MTTADLHTFVAHVQMGSKDRDVCYELNHLLATSLEEILQVL